jgi:hypothetical protein
MHPIPLINVGHVVRIASLLDANGIPADRYLEQARISPGALQRPLDSNGRDGLPRFGADSNRQSSALLQGSKSPVSCWARISNVHAEIAGIRHGVPTIELTRLFSVMHRPGHGRGASSRALCV